MKLKPLVAPAALALAAALVVVLAMRVKSLNRENEELFRRVTKPYVGMFVPSFTSATTDGGTVDVAKPQKGRQVIFVFNATCPYCRASIPEWTRISQAVEAANGRGSVIGVSLDSPDTARAYATRHSLRYPVAVFPDRRTSSIYRTRTVPVTMVVDTAGRVVLARIGELKEGPGADSVRVAAGLVRPPAAAPRT